MVDSDMTLDTDIPPICDSHSFPPLSHYPSHPIIFEEDESASDSEILNEPLTPTSGRASPKVSSVAVGVSPADLPRTASQTSTASVATSTIAPVAHKAPLYIDMQASAPLAAAENTTRSMFSTSMTQTSSSPQLHGHASPPASAFLSSDNTADDQDIHSPLSPGPIRRSSSSFKRTMSNLFRRAPTDPDMRGQHSSGGIKSRFSMASKPGSATASTAASTAATNTPACTTRSNTPSPPTSVLEMSPVAAKSPPIAAEFSAARSPPVASPVMSPTATALDIHGSSPDTHSSLAHAHGSSDEEDSRFLRKHRASSGLMFGRRAMQLLNKDAMQQRIDGNQMRRANSFDQGAKKKKHVLEMLQEFHIHRHHHHHHRESELEHSPWAFPPDQGTGVKARRMSLNLPDDFFVDVGDLMTEFEYQHKLLGRHGRTLGKGSTCKVTTMARKGHPDELYAVKEFRPKSKRESQEEYEKKVKSEYTIAKSLHHPNIVETFRLCTDRGRWNHVMEYCAEGDLFGLVSKGYLKKEERHADRACLFKQLVQGIHYLHTNGIAHRDIKLENLLITKDSKLKITDFGVSEVFSGTHPGLREAGGVCGRDMGAVRLCAPGICGSEPYIAPEVLAKDREYDARALDTWSAAVCMIYLVFGGNLWLRAEGSQKLYGALVREWAKWNEAHTEGDGVITETDYPRFKPFDVVVKPPALRRLLLQMLNPDPLRRISMAEVMRNRWMRNVECCQVESYDEPKEAIDVSKMNGANFDKRIYCHNHLPPTANHGSHSLGIMPGKPGY